MSEPARRRDASDSISATSPRRRRRTARERHCGFVRAAPVPRSRSCAGRHRCFRHRARRPTGSVGGHVATFRFQLRRRDWRWKCSLLRRRRRRRVGRVPSIGHGHNRVARVLGPRALRSIDRAVRVLPGLREQRRRRRARQAGRLRLPESTLYRRVVWSHWVIFVSKYIVGARSSGRRQQSMLRC